VGDPADFMVSYSVVVRDLMDLNSYPASYQREWSWDEAYYGTQVDVRAYREGTLVIDIFDAKTHKHVWHGWASKQITDADVENPAPQIWAAVKGILARFPPT
jgi:hypothetical protein